MARRLGTAWLVACLAIAAWLGLRPPSAPHHASHARGSAASRSVATVAHPSRAIEEIHVGDRVLGENPDLAPSTTATAVDPATWRLVKLHAESHWDDGTLDTVEVETVQPPSWISQHRARVGSSVPLPLDLTEMGLSETLRARVVAIEGCPPIAGGAGHVVLTTVNHLNRFICELTVQDAAGHREIIKLTGFHKFYSDTREAWISASELAPGERLRGVDGPLTVASVVHVPGLERVYNFSVEGEHVYRVSALGVLVHNDGCTPDFYTGSDGTTYPAPPIEQGSPVYRAWGGSSGPNGSYWSGYNPASVPNYPGAAGLPPGNTGQFVSSGVITDPTGITVQPAGPIGANPGGMPEIHIPDPGSQVQINVVSGGAAPGAGIAPEVLGPAGPGLPD